MTPRAAHSTILTLCFLPAALFLSSCATPAGKGTTATEDRAFIEYWPPPPGSDKPRLAIKDLIDMKGKVTTAGSEYFAKHGLPAVRDAACLANVRGGRVDIVGKTNTTEFAIAPSGANSYYGMPENPVDGRGNRISGGSSSGSAVAVANGSADIAFGTDTAGSIRVPAASCGILGLKTTFGRIPLKGVYPIAPQYLDTVGPMARDIPSLVLGMDLLDPGFQGEYRAAVAAKPEARQIRVGRLYLEGTRKEIDDAVDRALAARGFRVVRLNEKFTEAWKVADRNAATVALANAWMQNHQLRTQPEVSALSKLIITAGEAAYDTSYREAVAGRRPWQRDLRQIFREVDVLALPTLQQLPPRVRLVEGALFEGYALSLQNTAAVNLAGNPALAVPVPLPGSRIPTSVQLVGPPNSEARLVNIGRLLTEPAQLQMASATSN